MRTFLLLASITTFASGCSLLFSSSSHVGDTGSGDGSCANPNDRDGDGFRVCDGDCDDDDELVYPGAPPICGSGIVESCGTFDDARLLGFLGGAEMGFTLERLTIASNRVERLSLALTPGRGIWPIAAVVALTDGTESGSQWFVQNMVRSEMGVEFPHLAARGTPELLGSPALVPDLLSVVAAYDFDGIRLYRGVFQRATGLETRILHAINAPETQRVVGGTLSAVPTHLVSVASSLSAEEDGVHVLLLPGSLRRIAVAPANPLSVGDFVEYGLPFLPIGEANMRASADGAVVIQSATPSPFGLFRTPDQVYEIDDAAVTGPAAPLGGSGDTRLIFATTGGVGLARTSCAAGACDVTMEQTVYATTDLVTHVAGAPLPRLDGTSYRGLVGAMVLRSASARERTLLVFTDEGLGTMTDAPVPFPDLAAGGSILDLRVAGQTQEYDAPTGTVTAIVVAALVTRGDTREVVVGSIRTCETR